MKAASIAMIVILLVACFSEALAEEDTYYVFCQPDTHVNARAGRSLSSYVEGRLYLGDVVTIDSIKGNWAHATNLWFETTQAWIRVEYLSLYPVTQPSQPTQATIQANGRVAVRRGIKGERVQWIYNGNNVTVEAYTDEYVMTEDGLISRDYVVFDDE